MPPLLPVSSSENVLSALPPRHWLTVVAAIAQLALATVALRRRGESSLALPFGVLCVSLFGWNLSGLAHAVSGVAAFRHLDLALSPLTPATALHFVLVFAGRRRQLRVVLAISWAVFGLLSLGSLGAIAVPSLQAVVGSAPWSAVFLGAAVAAVALAVTVVVVHFRRAGSAEERGRAMLVLAALAVGGPVVSTELLNDFGVPVPGLGNVGTIFIALALAIVTFRFRLLGREGGGGTSLWAFGTAAVAVVLYLGVFQLFEGNLLAAVLAAATVTLLLALWLRHALRVWTIQRHRRERLTWLGRMSDQLAHDLKNPLAAMRGAVDVLQEERRQGRPLENHAGLLDLLGEQIERIGRVTEKYRRLGSIEPALEPCDIDAIVDRSIESLRHRAGDAVAIHDRRNGALARCQGDADLLAMAVDNVLANALDASEQGGRLWLSSWREGPTAVLSVRDEGPGMDARTLERAFDEFYTTKPGGTGLGLAFARRVLEAHGGEVRASSRPGEGTEIRLRLPVPEEARE